jgi:hypothetical protein
MPVPQLLTVLVATLLVIGGMPVLAQAPGGGASAQTGPPVRFFANLSADEQSTTTISPGIGRADFSLERATLRLSWRVSFERLTSAAIGAAVHGPQRPGTNAGVQIDMGGARPRPLLTGSAVLTDAQLEYLLAGRMYVNIRSSRYPAGELRGQIQRLPPAAKAGA